MSTNTDLCLAAIINQLGEEAAELSAACHKVVRKFDYPENPTPKTKVECVASMIEEMADVEVCIERFINSCTRVDVRKMIRKHFDAKKKRWAERLAEYNGENL